MSEYVEKCPCCSNHSLEVTQHDWGHGVRVEERQCDLCGFARRSERTSEGADGALVRSVSTPACAAERHDAAGRRTRRRP